MSRAQLHIRDAVRDDAARLTEIYNHYVLTTAITFDIEPYTIEKRAAWMATFAPTGRYRLLVAEDAGRIVGYAGTGQFRAKAAYDTTVEMTIYCAPEATGRGIGAALYRYLFDAIKDEDINRILAGITIPNPASIKLHERFGFRQTAHFTENGRKFGKYWDVVWMERPLRILDPAGARGPSLNPEGGL